MNPRLLPEATSAMRAGDLGRAYELFIQVGGTEGYANAGICAAQMGQFAEAANAFELASKSDPRDPQLRRYFGLSCQDAGRNEDAYRVLAEFSDPDSLLARGKASLITGRLKDAETCFRKSLQARPQWPAAWVNLGLTHLQSGSSEAESAFDRALRIDANYLPAIENLANVWQSSGRAADSIRLYERAIRLAPGDATLWLAKGQAEQLSQQFDAALASYQKVVELAPDQPAGPLNRAQILGERGDYAEAIKSLHLVIQTPPAENLAAWRRALLMPAIADSNDQIDEARAKLTSFLKVGPPPLTDVVTGIAAPGFQLAYQGRNNRDLARQVAEGLRNAYPNLSYRSESVDLIRTGRQRIIFASAHFRDHTVGLITLGLIREFSRLAATVIVVRPRTGRPLSSDDPIARQIRTAADECYEVSADPLVAREEIAAMDPDVIYYPDIGMEPWSYYLGFSRIATRQYVGWGHADTTGLPEIDGFLTTADFDPADADRYYSEPLLRLPRIPAFMAPPPPIKRPKPNWQAQRMYLLPQSLFKLHPDLDAALAGILRRDPAGVIGLPQGLHPRWQSLLEERFARTMPDVAGRVQFLPRVKPDDFAPMLAAADAVIDPMYFTGGYTSYQAIGSGVPVVTWNGDHLPGRMTAAMYQQSGITGLTASSAEEFASIAVRLATDVDFKAEATQIVQTAGATLFNDQAAVEGFADILHAP